MRDPQKAFPLGGRWHGEAVTDEGAMTERFRFLRGDFAACGRQGSSALRGGFLSGRPERNQRGARARLRMSASRSYSPPLDPIYGGYPLKWAGHFRRAKSGVLGCGSFRATGPWVCGKLELVRFRFCACRFRTNVPRLFSAVGAHSVRPRAGLGPAPTQRQTRFPILRRGRCPHPPAAGSDPPVGAAISRPKRPDGDIGPYKRANTFSDTPQEQPHAPARPRRSVM